MVFWGLWVVIALLDPALLDPAPSHLVLGLALVALLIVAAVRPPAPAPARVHGVMAHARRARASNPPRLTDPDAAGRPRPRAPSVCPAA